MTHRLRLFLLRQTRVCEYAYDNLCTFLCLITKTTSPLEEAVLV